MDKLINDYEVSKMLGVTRRCLQAWRQKKQGPKYFALSSRCVRYSIQDVETWLKSINNEINKKRESERWARTD